jgi:hypothetical protein
MTRPMRRERKPSPIAPRRAAPTPQPLRLPNGYYDPDSAAFDAPLADDIDELIRATTPLEPLLRPVRSS